MTVFPPQLGPDQTVPLEQAEGLPQWRPAHSQDLRQLLLDERNTRGKQTIKDGRAQEIGDLIDQPLLLVEYAAATVVALQPLRPYARPHIHGGRLAVYRCTLQMEVTDR